MAGGTCDDSYVVDNAGDVIGEAAGEGTDTITTLLLSYTLGANVEKLVYSSSKAFTGIGNALANMITPGSGADLLQGLNGDDTLSSGSGNDTLKGGASSDVLTGGDVMTGGAGADRLVFTKVSDFGTADILDRITDFVAVDGDRIDLATINRRAPAGTRRSPSSAPPRSRRRPIRRSSCATRWRRTAICWCRATAIATASPTSRSWCTRRRLARVISCCKGLGSDRCLARHQSRGPTPLFATQHFSVRKT